MKDKNTITIRQNGKNIKVSRSGDTQRDKRGNVYELSEREDSLVSDVGRYKFKLMQFILYRIKDTDVWIYTKRGWLGETKECLIERVNKAEEPKPKTFKDNLYGYHFGQTYKTDEDGEIIGDWPVIGEMILETDMVKIVTGKDLQNHKLWTMLPIPFSGIVDMKNTKEDGFG